MPSPRTVRLISGGALSQPAPPAGRKLGTSTVTSPFSILSAAAVPLGVNLRGDEGRGAGMVGAINLASPGREWSLGLEGQIEYPPHLGSNL